MHFFGTWASQAVIEIIAVAYELTKKSQEKLFSPIGHNNTKHFLCPVRSRHPLEFLEIARWESVPRGSFARTWKLSSRPFSRPDWLPLGLRGWYTVWTSQNEKSVDSLWERADGFESFYVGKSTLWSTVTQFIEQNTFHLVYFTDSVVWRRTICCSRHGNTEFVLYRLSVRYKKMSKS